MWPVAIFFFLACFSRAFCSAIRPRVAETIPNQGQGKYDEGSTWELDYEEKAIKAYQFIGKSVFDLPQTFGLILQDFLDDNSGRRRVQKSEESRAVYVLAEKGLLVMGVTVLDQRSKDTSLNYTSKKERIPRMAQRMLNSEVLIKDMVAEGLTPAPEEKPTLKDVLSKFKREGGHMRGAGLLGLESTGPESQPFSTMTDSFGLALRTALGISARPWISYTGPRDTKAFLAWVQKESTPTLMVAIGNGVVMRREKGSKPFNDQNLNTISAGSDPDMTKEIAAPKIDCDDDAMDIDGGDSADYDDDAMEIDDEPNENIKSTSIREIFHMKTGKTKGACDGLKALPTWFAESKEMAKAGLQAFSDAKQGNKIAKDTLKQFLGITSATSDREFRETRRYLLEVYQFFVAELYLAVGTTQFKPWLFCGSGWTEQKKRTDISLDPDGEVKLDSNNQPLEIQHDPDYADELWDEEGAETIPTDLVPYWSRDLKKYLFEEDYQGKGYCAFTGHRAGTNYRTTPYTMDLCSGASKRDAAHKLGGRTAALKPLMKVLPRSATFFHESFHLVHTWVSFDSTDNVDAILKALKSPRAVPDSTNLDEPDKSEEGNVDNLTNVQLVRWNPETWVFLCVSYWYTLNKKMYFPNGGKGQAI